MTDSCVRNRGLAIGCILTVAALASPAACQHQFTPFQGLPDINGWRLAVGDIDGDGDVDIIAPSMSGPAILLRNDGRGRLATSTLAGVVGARNSALLDLDADGDLDMVGWRDGPRRSVPPYYTTTRWIWLNDGTGAFSLHHTLTYGGNEGSYGVIAVADFDGDGDDDLMVGGEQRFAFYHNVGNGSLPRSPGPAGSNGDLDVAAGDIDGDGDTDLVVASRYSGPHSHNGAPNRILRNDGTGSFHTEMLPWWTPTMGVALADVDTDGDLDLFEANDDISGIDFENRLYLNDGSGAFTLAVGAVPTSLPNACRKPVLADFDGDGDLDAIVPEQLATNTQYLLNDGRGVFTDASHRLAGHRDFWMGAADLDGDGDVDLIRNGVPFQIAMNLRQQIHVASPPRVGSDYALDIYARYAPSTLAAAYVSPASASLPVPGIGTLAIDPTQAIALPWVAVPQPQGNASASIAIPNDPNLIGLSLYGQTLFVEGATGRLSNATFDIIQQ